MQKSNLVSRFSVSFVPMLHEAIFFHRSAVNRHSHQILALKHKGLVKSAAGFRFAEFLAWGKVLYIDNLTTLPGETSQGFASALLDWLIDHARSSGCQGVHLDTSYARHAAHRLYLRKGLQLSSHHLALEFKVND